MRDKIFVDQVKIREMLSFGMKPYSIALKLKIPRSVPDRILLGKDVPYYYKKPARDKKNLCTKCHCSPKADGFRFLCLTCYRSASSDDQYKVSL